MSETYADIKDRHIVRGNEPDVSPPRPYVVASTRAGKPAPVRAWLVDGWIPRRQVTLIGGIGGAGKTLLALQLMIGAASSGNWLGLPVMRCRAFGLFAEDEDDEIDLRLRDNAELADLGDLAWRSAVLDQCELADLGPDGQMRATPFFDQIRQNVLNFGARLVVLDAAADLFGGDEIRRRHVAFLIRLLRRLAIEIDGAVVLLAHPSNHGISNGTGISGSTAWANSVRSLLVFEPDSGEDADEDERILRRQKANYARRGEVIRMRWNDGVFVALETPGSIDRAAMNAKADRVFKELLAQTYSVGTWTSPNCSARNYAPSVFIKQPERGGKPALEAAMSRLLHDGRVKVEAYGRPSEPRHRPALADVSNLRLRQAGWELVPVKRN